MTAIGAIRSRAIFLCAAAAGIGAAATGCGSTSGPPLQVTREDREQLRALWQLYLRDDPAWPRARREWIARGEDARKILIENLLAELVRAVDRGDPARRERASGELAGIGPAALPHLAEALRQGDDVVGKECSIVIARMGAAAVEPVLGLLPLAAPRARSRLLEALGEIGDPRSAPALERALGSESDWKVRSIAATALGKVGGPGAFDSLVAATRDADPFVRSRVAAGLGRLGDTRAVDRLIALLESSYASADPDQAIVLRECGAALRALTGESFGEDPRAWRDWRLRNASGR